jgi:hypothetical protein
MTRALGHATTKICTIIWPLLILQVGKGFTQPVPGQHPTAVESAPPKASSEDSDENYTFDMLLHGDPHAIAGAKKKFAAITDPKGKMRIASILISRGVQDRIYIDYLTAEARKALANPIPWPIDDTPILTDDEGRVIKLLWKSGATATIDQLENTLTTDPQLRHDSLWAAVHSLESKGYIQHIKTETGDTYRTFIAIREIDVDMNYVQAYTMNPAFISWCKQHPQKEVY